MSALLDQDQVAGHISAGGGRVRVPVRARRAAGEVRRPPTRARVVAGHRRAPAPACAPRRTVSRWPWLAAAGVAAGLFITGLGVFADGVSGGVPEETATVAIGPGQTLWDLAREYAPGSDPDAVVARIRQLNGMGDAVPVPGLPLTVPLEPRPTVVGS